MSRHPSSLGHRKRGKKKEKKKKKKRIFIISREIKTREKTGSLPIRFLITHALIKREERKESRRWNVLKINSRGSKRSGQVEASKTRVKAELSQFHRITAIIFRGQHPYMRVRMSCGARARGSSIRGVQKPQPSRKKKYGGTYVRTYVRACVRACAYLNCD